MNKRDLRRRRKPWPLAKLYAECRAAPVVWAALWAMSVERGSPIVFPTRQSLATATGIRRLPTITASLKALADARWIDRIHVRVPRSGGGVATCLRVILRYGVQETFAMKSKSMANANRSHSSAQNSFADSSLRKRGRSPKTPPPAKARESSDRPGALTLSVCPNDEHRSARIEREQLEEIRRRREDRDEPGKPVGEIDGEPVSSVP